MKRKYLFLIIWLAFILYASLSPADDIPKFKIPHFDKLVHFCMYFGLAFLLVPVFRSIKKIIRSYSIALLVAAGTGIVFEVLQYLMNIGRTASVYDALANTIGALAGILAYHLLVRNRPIEKFVFRIE